MDIQQLMKKNLKDLTKEEVEFIFSNLNWEKLTIDYMKSMEGGEYSIDADGLVNYIKEQAKKD